MKQQFMFVVMSFLLLTTSAFAQKQVAQTTGKMPLLTKSEQARKLALSGMHHSINVEQELAYQDFKAATDLDPGFTEALAILSVYSRGEAKKEYARRAIESASKKGEGEKLFASLVDEKATPESSREIWNRLHVLYPNDVVMAYYFASSRNTPEERLAALTDGMQKFPEEPAFYNLMGYYYMNDKKDNEKAKEYFEKYIQMNPESANPYDSMGEFYLNTGDMEKSEKYYRMALERYPFMASSLMALQKIKDGKAKGDKK